MLLSQFPLTSHHIHNRKPCFIALLMAILVLIGMIFVIILEMFHGRISLNLVLLLLLVNFVSGFRLELMYISLIESIRSSFTHFHGFQLLVPLPQFIEITFESFESKVRFRQASNCCKRILEVAKLAYANKTKESIASQKLDSQTFGKFLIVFSTKVNLLYFLYSMIQRCCLLHLIKQYCWLKTFLRTLDDSGNS